MGPIDLPDGRPPLAREFSTAHMLAKLVREVEHGILDWKVVEAGVRLVLQTDDRPDPIQVIGLTIHGALAEVGDVLGLWRTDDTVAEEVEREAHSE